MMMGLEIGGGAWAASRNTDGSGCEDAGGGAWWCSGGSVPG